jgi:O-acetyl-ADP-ribose deacetylase (regulator of RNase III)
MVAQRAMPRSRRAYNLPSKHVIHTVGPVWRGGGSAEAELLASCYMKSLQLAEENKLSTIAFPNISTGVYGYPKQKAAEIALTTVIQFQEESIHLEELMFCVFDTENFNIYLNLLRK